MTIDRADPSKFSGDVWVDIIAPTESDVSAGIVRFAPGARTAWHTHPKGQTLRVTEGVAIVAVEGEVPVLVSSGDSHFTPVDTPHWHGALPDGFMTHIAIAANGHAGAVEWRELVDDDAYAEAVRRAHHS